MGDWEIRGLFGNEIAMENAVDELRKLPKMPAFKVLDRRNLQIVISEEDKKSRQLVKNVIKIAHGFVEGDAPLGDYDKKKKQITAEKLKQYEEKRKRIQKEGNK